MEMMIEIVVDKIELKSNESPTLILVSRCTEEERLSQRVETRNSVPVDLQHLQVE